MAEKILVVDDEIEITDLLGLYLENEGYEVYKFYCAQDALGCINTIQLDLAILDVMLPDMNGFALCRRIREKYTFPIIMLTAKGEETDKINGLAFGADDYVTKPFRPLELMARVKAHLRRRKKYDAVVKPESTVLTHLDLVMDIENHSCVLDNKPLALTPTEFSLLRILLERKGSVVSAEELFHLIWKEEYYTKNNNTINVHIRHLREKMNETVGKSKYIHTVWGVGYKIEG